MCVWKLSASMFLVSVGMHFRMVEYLCVGGRGRGLECQCVSVYVSERTFGWGVCYVYLKAKETV